MNSRLGLMGILAIGCLAIIPAMNGCSTTDGETDGGTKADAGKTDGGPKTDGGTDGGTSTKGSLGSVCADSSTQSQSTCQRGLNCYPLTDNNYCSKECDPQAEGECGTNGSFDNLCIDVGAPLCLRGCDPEDRSTCGRADLACYDGQDQSGNTIGVCFPACETDDDCTYGYRCNATSGVCEGKPCGTNNTCADSADVCYVRQSGGQTVKTCVPKCATSGCRAGRECNNTTNVCDPIVRNTYESCGAEVGECAGTDICVGFGNPGSLCLHPCTTDNDCASGSTCSVGLGNNQKVCAITCGTPAAPNAAACPGGTSCNWYTDSSKSTLFCGP